MAPPDEQMAATRTDSEVRTVVDRFYAASLRADVDAVGEVLADGVVIVEAPSLPYGGTHSGRARALALLSQLYSGIDLDAIPRPEVLVGGDRAAAFVDVAFRHSDGGTTIV